MSVPKQVGYRRIKEDKPRKRNAEDYKKYLEDKKIPEMDIYYQDCGRNWNIDFMTIAKEHKKLNNNLAIEYVESWSPEETKRVGAEKLYSIGINNAKAAFPNHSFVVVPHYNDNGCFHTHVLFCRISNDGIAMKSDWKNRSRWNNVCDKSSRENGLSTVEKRNSKQKERLSRAAREAVKHGRTSHQHSVMRKADIARRISVNLQEFISFMGELGVRVNDRGNVLTYFPANREKGIRDRKLGELYKKEQLFETFKRNEYEQRARPKIRKYLEEQSKYLHDGKGNLLGDKDDFPYHPGGHQKFKKQLIQKRDETIHNGDRESNTKNQDKVFADNLGYTIYDSIHRSITEASNRSIVEYCKNNGIALNENKDGSYTIKGREHILIKGNKWENIKTKKGRKVGTQGTLIEFVANHKDVNLLESIALITGNERLHLLQSYLGLEDKTYREFTIPFSRRKNEKESVSAISKLLKSLGHKSEMSLWLYKTKRVQVNTQGVIRFLLGDKNDGAVSYSPKKDGTYNKSLLGKLTSSFLKQHGTSPKMHLFKDPFEFMKETNSKGLMNYKSSDNILVLGDKNLEALDFFLANNKSVKEIDLFGFDAKELSSQKKMELSKHGIKVNFIDISGKSRSKEKGLDFSR